jgi:ABC-2 type transport system permease protein
MTTAVAIRPMRPSLARVSKARVVHEMRVFLREPAAVGFTVLFPVMLLILFGSMFSDTVEGTDVSFSQVYVAGIVASSLMSVGFMSLAIGVTIEREFGMLKRLAGTPMPKAAYFLGKVGSVLILALVQSAIMLAIGVVLFDLTLPTDLGRWVTFAWVFILGSGGATMLGLAAGGLIPSSKAAPAILNVPFVALQFISGVFVPETQLSSSIRSIASIFPLRWMCKGMRSVFLPDSFLVAETPGSWQHGTVVLVLLAWCAIGALVTARTFRWVGKER